MAKKSRTKKTVKKNSSFLKDGRLKKIVGVMLIFGILFLFTCMFSYLSTWKQDQDKVVSAKNALSFVLNKDIKVDNLAGRLGAISAHNIVFNGFGLASYLILLFIAVLIVYLLQRKPAVGILKFLFYTVLSVILLSPLLAYFLNLQATTFHSEELLAFMW